MAETGPTADELAKAKSYLKGSYVLGLDTSSKIAAMLNAPPPTTAYSAGRWWRAWRLLLPSPLWAGA